MSIPLCLTLITACAQGDAERAGPGREEPSETPRYGGTAVVAEISDIDDLNPLTFSSLYSYEVITNLLFLPFLGFDDRFEVVPSLAETWELSEDSTTVTFRLRQDVFWHDGIRTTAHDVAFSYERFRDPETASIGLERLAGFGEGEAVDSFTFRMKLTPHADFLSRLALVFIPVPEHLLGDVPPSELRTNGFGREPVGNGPFRFSSRTPGQQWVFVANEEFPPGLGGRPYLDRLVYRVIPEQTTLLAELLTGTIDLTRISGFQQDQVESSRNTRVVASPSGRTVYIAWNTRRPVLSDARVRRAISMAIDRQGLIEGILHGRADPAYSPVVPEQWPFDPYAADVTPFDPDSARRLLADAGWSDRNGNGILEDSRGRELRITVEASRASVTARDIVEKIESDLRRVGVRMDPRFLEFNTLVARATDPTRNFDAVLLSGGSPSYPDVSQAEFHCRSVQSPLHMSGICDEELDRLIDSIPKILDREESRPLWSAYQRRLAELQPHTFLYYPHNLFGVNIRLRNLRAGPGGLYIGAREWWIATDGLLANGRSN